jgi:glucose-6-phosphate 1-dehydrogenase
MKLYVDNWRWQDVPFYLRSGKALAEKASEITIEFRRPPHLLFRLPDAGHFTPNTLSLCIQPDEGIHLCVQAKLPDSEDEMRLVDMNFHYSTSFNIPLPDAYERLLLEAWHGDQSLFTRSDAIEAAWRLIDPVLQAWEQPGAPALKIYPQGSQGPAQADELIARDGRCWQMTCVGYPEAGQGLTQIAG